MSYNISFFINGYGQQPDNLTNISVLPELPVLTEDGFIFDGWFLDEDLTILAEVGMKVTSDLTLYASWSRNRGRTAGSGNSSGYAIIDTDLVEPGGGSGNYTITFVMNGYGTQLPPLTNMAALPKISPPRQDARAHFDG